jgi:hypothetical protein
MITIRLRLSESLLSLFRDSGSPKKEILLCRTEPGITVKEILADQNINPLLVPMVSMEAGTAQKRISRDTILREDAVLTLYGPLAGG